MSMNDLHGKPGHLIRRAHQIIVGLFMEECAALDVTPVQYATLVAIRETPDADATRIAALIAFDRSTLGSVLDRLEKKNLIARGPGRDDRRVKTLTLTAAGKKRLAEAEPAVKRSQERLLAALKPAQRTQLIALLAELVELNNESSRAPLRLVSGGE